MANLADGFRLLAVPWLATLMSADPFEIAVVSAALFLPWTIFSLPAGVWSDRFEHARLIRFCDGLRVILGGCLIVLSLDYQREGAVWLLAALAFMIGCAEAVRDTTAQTYLPRLVDKGSLEKANGSLMAAENLTGQFMGPVIAGAVMTLFVSGPFVVYAVAMALSFCLISLLVGEGRKPAAPMRFRTAFNEGLQVFVKDIPLRRMAFVLGFVNFFGAMTMTMQVLFAQEVLAVQSSTFGVMLAVMALGAVLGSMIAPRLQAQFGTRVIVISTGILFSTFEGLLAFAWHPWHMGACFFILGCATFMWNVVTISWRQRRVAAHKLGRVNAIYRFLGLGLMPLGAMIGGLWVSYWEQVLTLELALRSVYMLSAAGVLLGTLYFYLAVRVGDPPDLSEAQ